MFLRFSGSFRRYQEILVYQKGNQEKLQYCYQPTCSCQGLLNTFVEAFNNNIIFKVSNTNIKTIDTTALYDISNKNSFPKAIITWNSHRIIENNSNNSENLNNLHSSKCQNIINCSSTSWLEKESQFDNPLLYTTQKPEPSACILELAQDRMVTSPLSSNNVSCSNANTVVDKKKSQTSVERSSSTSNNKGFCGNKSKNKENVKYKDPQLEAKKDHTSKRKGEKFFSDTNKQQNKVKSETSYSFENGEAKFEGHKHEKESDLEEVGKLLQQVLSKPTSQNNERNNYQVAHACSGGSDTGYSSRCSTPPAPGVADGNLDDEKADPKRVSSEPSRIPSKDLTEERRISRSESPSAGSDSSSGSSNFFQGRNNCQDGYQRFNMYPHHSAKPFQRPQYYIVPCFKTDKNDHNRNQNGFNCRMRHQGNNEAHFNYRNMERIVFHQGQPNHSHSSSSHQQNVDRSGKPTHNGRHYNQYHNQQKGDGHFNQQKMDGHFNQQKMDGHFNQQKGNGHYNQQKGNGHYNQQKRDGYYNQYNQQKDDGKGGNWGINQRYNNMKNRQYGNPNFQPNGFPDFNIYYQADSQLDLREQVWGYQRRLSDRAGTFTVASGNQAKWRRDHRTEATGNPPELLTNSKWDDLSLQVWKLFAKHQQLDSTFRAKMELKQRISHVIWNVLPMCRLFVVGSSLSGFGANSSDVDMCLMITPRDLDQRNEAQSVLRLLQRELNNCGFVEKMELITAKVPILKFRDVYTKIDVDLNCNNSVGIRNTHLLNAYSQLDWRVRPLVLVVKLWAQHHHINNAKDMTISSYSLVLMVIHYLQYGLETPLLPCLQKAFPDKFNAANHVFKMPVTERMPLFVSNNTQTIGELFLGFLEYYAYKFTFIENAMSIRTGGILPTEECRFVRTRKNDSRMWKYLCIEEPFDLTNTARSVYDEVVFEKVKNVFKDSHKVLKDSMDLNSIFSRP